MENNRQTLESTCRRIKDDILAEREAMRMNTPSIQEAVDALAHHQKQLIRLGATLEDDVCQVLKKAIEVAKSQKKIEQLESDLRECKMEIYRT